MTDDEIPPPDPRLDDKVIKITKWKAKSKPEADKEPDTAKGNGHTEADGEAPSAEIIDLEVARLAKLRVAEYESARKNAAKKLGVRAPVLDKLVEAMRTRAAPGQGRPLEFVEPEQWPHAVDGAALLVDLANTIRKYVVLSAADAQTVALWCVHTFAFEVFYCTPRLAATSPEKRCGKTTLLDVVKELVARPMPTASFTAAALFRTVEIAKPTLLIDEADTFLRDNDELRGVLNSGHRRGGQVTRTVGDNHEPRVFSTHCPVVIAMIGKLPDTLDDRSIKIALKRRLPSEPISCFRGDRVDGLNTLARKAARWAADNASRIARADPELPPGIYNREADNWRPLFAISAIAGGEWPELVRRAAVASTGAPDDSLKALLLADIRDAFGGRDRISSDELVTALNDMKDRPWCESNRGRPLSQNGLARRLRPFELTPKKMRIGDQTLNGYTRDEFDEKCAPYLPTLF